MNEESTCRKSTLHEHKSIPQASLQGLWNISLARKIQIGTVTIVALLATLIIAYAFMLTSEAFLSEGKRHGDMLSKNLALQAVDPLLAQDALRLTNLVTKVSTLNERVAYCFIMGDAGFTGGQARVEAHSFGTSFPIDLLEVNALSYGIDTQIILLDTAEGAIYDIATRMKVGDKSIGTVRLGIWKERLLQTVQDLLMPLAVVSFSVLLVAVAVSSFFAYRVTRRLNALRSRTELLVRHDLHGETLHDKERGTRHYGDEIAAMDASFTQLSEALHHHVENLRASQAQLVQAQKMDALGALAGGVAHEINTPLGIILGYTQLLQEDVPEHFGDSAGQVCQDLAIIERQAQACRKIVADLLSFSRQSRDSHEKRHMCFNNSVMEVVLLVEHAFALEHVFITTCLDDRLPGIYGNPSTLQQVWLNMLNNARDAMPQGGHIYVTTQLDLEKMIVSVSFADTGTGIAEEHLHAIFDPFFTTKPVDKGTGLGLSVSFGIIQDHQGFVQVMSPVPKGILPYEMNADTVHERGASRFGAGTVITVSLPLEQDFTENTSDKTNG